MIARTSSSPPRRRLFYSMDTQRVISSPSGKIFVLLLMRCHAIAHFLPHSLAHPHSSYLHLLFPSTLALSSISNIRLAESQFRQPAIHSLVYSRRLLLLLGDASRRPYFLLSTCTHLLLLPEALDGNNKSQYNYY